MSMVFLSLFSLYRANSAEKVVSLQPY